MSSTKKKTFICIIHKPSKWEQSQASFVTGFYGAILVDFPMASGELSKSPDLRGSPGVLIGSVCCCDRRLSVTGVLSLPCILPVEALYLTSSRDQEDFEVYQIRWFFQDYLHSTFQLIYIDVCWTCLLVLRGWSLLHALASLSLSSWPLQCYVGSYSHSCAGHSTLRLTSAVLK